MSFIDLPKINFEYHTAYDQVVDEFYNPVLSEAVSYKRAVGFFSSTILLEITKGLGKFVDNGGHMKLIVSPRLDEKDYEAIKNGYSARQVVEKRVIEDFDFDVEFDQKEDRFRLLSYLIEKGLLDIKIAFLEKNNDIAMYHEKLGIFEDLMGNVIAFTGSANETANAVTMNYESIDVFCSWRSEESEMRCTQKQNSFYQKWKDNEKGLITIPFPEVIKQKILKFKPTEGKVYAEIDENFGTNRIVKSLDKGEPTDADINWRDYQLKAIDNWAKNNYCGIFDMATGTGKTFTGAGAILRLLKDKKRAIVLICCPYTHLVEQWYEELLSFNIESIKCYGNLDYEKELKRSFAKFKQKRSDFSCLIFTNATFRLEKIQSIVTSDLKNTLLVVDEAHNFGSFELSKCLKQDYRYRLALSATIDRYGDETGTEILHNFFGEKAIEYTLEQAIADGKLAKYYYHPVIVHLNDCEMEKYVEISRKIAKFHGEDYQDNDYYKSLLIKRCRVVAGALSKVDALIDILKGKVGEKNILVYCGAVIYHDDYISSDPDGIRQIELVVKRMADLGMKTMKFTAEESKETRTNIVNSFKDGELDALVAVKCLDEGMNIPSIKTAYILSSSTNPKEYIQRRGRVLRLAPGKQYSEIYDFITIPLDVDKYDYSSDEERRICKNLIRKEFNRMREFSNIAINVAECNQFIDDIRYKYDLDVIDVEEGKYE